MLCSLQAAIRMRTFMLFIFAVIALLHAAAQGMQGQAESDADHKAMMDRLHIASIREGANGMDPKAPNYATLSSTSSCFAFLRQTGIS